MKCPECGNGWTSYCTRPVGDYVSRHYKCKHCGFLGRTIEMLVQKGAAAKPRRGTTIRRAA